MRHTEQAYVRVDWYTRLCLTVISVLLTILVVGLWADTSHFSAKANAAPGFKNDKAKQALYEGRWGSSSAPGKFAAVQEGTNGRLDRLIGLFTTGQAKVQVADQMSTGQGDSKSVSTAK